MLEKYINLPVYQDDKRNNLRKVGLILTSLIPLFLLFSRVAADTALTVTGILFVVHCIKDKNYSYIKQPVVIVLLLLWLWFIIGSFFAFHSVIDAFLMSFVFIRYILFFFACIYWIFDKIEAFKFAAKIITITIIVAASDALFQFITGFSISGKEQFGGRLTSFLRRPDIGIYLVKLIFPIVGLWISIASHLKNKRNLLLSLLLLLFIILVVFLTGERSATALSLICLTLVLFLIGIANKRLRVYMMFGACGIIIAFTLVVYNSSFIQKRVADFVSDISNFPNSLYGQLFKASILSWQEYGIFTGVGIRQFRYSCPSFEEQGLVTYCDLHSHNIYLEILSESGIVGFSLFVIFVILCIYQGVVSIFSKHQDFGIFAGGIFALAGLCTIFFPISVTMSFITNWSGSLNWLGISLCVSLLKLLRQDQIKLV